MKEPTLLSFNNPRFMNSGQAVSVGWWLVLLRWYVSMYVQYIHVRMAAVIYHGQFDVGLVDSCWSFEIHNTFAFVTSRQDISWRTRRIYI